MGGGLNKTDCIENYAKTILTDRRNLVSVAAQPSSDGLSSTQESEFDYKDYAVTCDSSKAQAIETKGSPHPDLSVAGSPQFTQSTHTRRVQLRKWAYLLLTTGSTGSMLRAHNTRPVQNHRITCRIEITCVVTDTGTTLSARTNGTCTGSTSITA